MDRTANEQVAEYNSRAHIERGTRHHLNREYDLALQEFQKAGEAKPKLLRNPKFYLNVGVVQYDSGRLEDALSCFSKALELNPKYALALNNVGNVYRQQGRLKDALEAYDAAYELSKAETSWNGIMQCLIELRDYTEALERVEEYLRFSPTNQNALSMQVFLLAHLKREVEAAEAALYLLKSEEVEMDVHTRKLFAYVISSAAAHRKSLELWQHVCALEPTYSNMIHLGIEYERRKQLQSALKAYFVASKMAPHKYGARYRIGKIHFAQSRYKHAALHFREALLLIRKDTNANGFVAHLELALGVTLLNTGDYDAAIALLEKNKVRLEFKPVLALLYLITGKQVDALNAMHVSPDQDEEDPRLMAAMYYTTFLLLQRYMPGKFPWLEADCLSVCLRLHPGHERANEELKSLGSGSAEEKTERKLESELVAAVIKFLEDSPAGVEVEELKEDMKRKEIFTLKELSQVEGIMAYGKSIQALYKYLNEKREPKNKKKHLARMRSCPLPVVATTEVHRGKHFIDAIKLRRSNLYTDELSDDSGEEFPP